MSAPLFKSFFTVSASPFSQAMCNAVFPLMERTYLKSAPRDNNDSQILLCLLWAANKSGDHPSVEIALISA